MTNHPNRSKHVERFFVRYLSPTTGKWMYQASMYDAPGSSPASWTDQNNAVAFAKRVSLETEVVSSHRGLVWHAGKL